MDTSIIVAVISAVVTLAGTVITIVASNSRIQQQIAVNQAVMSEQLKTLTNNVEKHNKFGERIPLIEEQIKVINHRIEDLENGK